VEGGERVLRRRRPRGEGRDRREPRLLREDVYDAVCGEIVTGELRPGQFLGEEGLASRLGTSRTPVREALVRLQRDGLVEMVPHRGAFVRWPSPKDVEDVFDIRIAVEGLALRKAFPRLDEGVVRGLLDRLELQAESLPRVSAGEAEALSVELHLAPLRAAGNARAVTLIRRFREQVYPGRMLYAAPDGRLCEIRARRVIADHRALLQAILARDLERALRTLERHLEGMKDMVMEALREGGWPGERNALRD
jgi:DNA-binding GntR family transcriptional regulator